MKSRRGRTGRQDKSDIRLVGFILSMLIVVATMALAIVFVTTTPVGIDVKCAYSGSNGSVNITSLKDLDGLSDKGISIVGMPKDGSCEVKIVAPVSKAMRLLNVLG